MQTAKLFKNGRSQAVRLPKDYRFDGTEVAVRREGSAVILEPITRREWPKGYWARIERDPAALDLGAIPPLGARLLDIHENEP